VVTLEQVKENLITENEVMERLGKLEPLGSVALTKDSKVKFEIDPEWSLDVDTLEDSDPVKVHLTIDGQERQLSKEAFFQSAVNMGLPMSTVKRVPHDAVQGFLNRTYRDSGKEYNVLSVDGLASAFTPPTIIPFSNLELMERVLGSIRSTYGSDSEVYADFKFNHSLTRTDVRLIVPAEFRRMQDTHMDDVPHGQEDDWAAGIHLSNSLIGKSQTTLQAYMFRWWCSNGCTTKLESVGKWDRRSNVHHTDEVYRWAAEAVNEVLGGMEERFDQVQALTSLEVQDPATALNEVFGHYSLPARQRNRILDTVVSTSDLTMYTLMQAVTEAANDPALSPGDVNRLLHVGGDFAGEGVLDPIKARVFRSGQMAGPDAPNPFEISTRIEVGNLIGGADLSLRISPLLDNPLKLSGSVRD